MANLFESIETHFQYSTVTIVELRERQWGHPVPKRTLRTPREDAGPRADMGAGPAPARCGPRVGHSTVVCWASVL